MSISRDEAVAALRDVEMTEARAKTARAYRIGSPHLILWGVIWIVGYAASGLMPGRFSGPFWLVLTLIGVAGALLINRAGGRPVAELGATGKGRGWFLAFTAIWIFVVMTYVVLRPTSLAQYLVYPGMVVGLVYVWVAAWGQQPRYLWIGTAVFALSLIGFFFLRPYLAFWMAGIGGGGLILGGVWLRTP